jgi:hypothetical protein
MAEPKEKPRQQESGEAPQKPRDTLHSVPRAVELVKKLSTKTICGEITKPEKPHPVFRIAGVSHGIRTGNSQFGDYTAFVGTFRAKNLLTQKEYASGTCFLPKVVEEMLISALREKQSVDTLASVEFSIEVGVTPSKKAAVGYEYTVRPLREFAVNDALSNLLLTMDESPA